MALNARIGTDEITNFMEHMGKLLQLCTQKHTKRYE